MLDREASGARVILAVLTFVLLGAGRTGGRED
jgi:hypothetical protein